jgi:hypothetical protein
MKHCGEKANKYHKRKHSRKGYIHLDVPQMWKHSYIYFTTRGILHELHKKFSENLARGSSFPNQELQRTQSSLRSYNRKSPAYMERF